MKKYLLSLVGVLLSGLSFAQGNSVDMANTLRSSGKIYVVVSILAIIFLGLTIFLFSLDYRVRKLQKEVEKQ